MLYGVIDVGSNSVRLMISNGLETISKKVKTTRLAEGMSNGYLTANAINKTATAVCEFVSMAKEQAVDEIYIFATAAVRVAVNSKEFLDKVYSLCKMRVDVVSGELEAQLGLLGALSGKDGGIVDVGGASSEVAVIKSGKNVYSKSIKLGAVSLKDTCGQDYLSSKKFVIDKISEYGKVLPSDFYAIGGTATSIASIFLECEPYDPKKINGFKISAKDLSSLTLKLYKMSVQERQKLKGLQPERAEVIAGGALILLEIMNKIGVDYVTVSESDNLEGYLAKKMENK
ncbi:MAG: hypothetical protein E7373_03220 [Clostridiales bacterium]|nr:hypothetical protein [Clostridiales bacterium]